MEAKKHPAYSEERRNLETTVGEINGEIEKIEKTYGQETMYGPPDTIRILSNQRISYVKKCKAAKQDLYFGRVDWRAKGNEERETFYIGRSPLHPYIIAWQETLAADLYYNQSTTREDGELLLVRMLRIEDGVLRDLEDGFKDASVAGAIDPDSVLAQILSESRGMLGEIVATINAQQNRIIREPLGDSFIVQGVPGSGKTVIALHRIAYLLYNYKELRSQNILILGPNPIFMKYVSQVLPSLGERNIPQKTFDLWIMDQLGERLSYQSQEDLLEVWLAPDRPPAEKSMHLRNCRNMGSLRMGTVLDRYVELLQEEMLQGKRGLTCNVSIPASLVPGGRSIRAERNLEQVASTVRDAKDLPLNQRREAFEAKLTNDLVSEVLRGMPRESRQVETLRKRIVDQVREQVHEHFTNWRSFNVSIAYRRLFRKPGLLHQLGGDLFSRWDLELMRFDAPTARAPFRFSDLVGLLYFKLLLNGTENESYGHIVIDEAQDIPPLFFLGLSKFIPTKSVTVLGDIEQGVFLRNGLESWDELRAVFPSLNSGVEELRVCYRSTFEIMTYANTMLRRVGTPDDKLIKPLNRSGRPVGLFPCETEGEQIADIIRVIRDELKRGYQSIAVICKTAHDCQHLGEMLHKSDFHDFALVDNRDSDFRAGVVLIPAYLTKGLEFDAALIADGHNYAADDLSVKLLFVAITRPAHVLHVFWLGQQSPLLDGSSDRCIIEPFLTAYEGRDPLNMGAYARANSLDPDWCMEVVAREGLMPLMVGGEIDPIIMDLLVLQNAGGELPSAEEVVTVQLSDDLELSLREQIRAWDGSLDSKIQAGLALIQTAFGLLRHHIIRLGLDISKDRELFLIDQVVLLLRLRKLLLDSGISVPSGRWAGTRRLADEVDHARVDEHIRIVGLLLDYGVLESQITADGRRQVRVVARWIDDLLRLALGHPSVELDPDLLAALPSLPVALDTFSASEAANG